MSPCMQEIMSHKPKVPIKADVTFFIEGDPEPKTKQEMIEYFTKKQQSQKAHGQDKQAG